MLLLLTLVLWVAWTTVAWHMILESEAPLLPQRTTWCALQVFAPFLGWPIYLLFGTGYLARTDAELWPHRHPAHPDQVPVMQ